MKQQEASQQADQQLSADKPKPVYKLVDPASAYDQPGPKLQALIDSIGTANKEDVRPDLLFTTTGQSVPLSAEEIEDMERELEEFNAREGQEIPLPMPISEVVDAETQQPQPFVPTDIPDQLSDQVTNTPEMTFSQVQILTADMFQENIDSLERGLAEVATNIQIGWQNLNQTNSIDLLYATSIGFLIFITMAIVAGLFSYSQMLKQPAKDGHRPSVRMMMSSMLGRGSPDQNDDVDRDQKGLAERAYGIISAPFEAILRSGSNADGGFFGQGSNPNNEISRLSLQYSSANMSEEESSSLINILDRKKYNERIQATRSADDHNPQPSFFEKISTGSNTDSDLRVVRFDCGAAKGRDLLNAADAAFQDDDESVPKFRKPIPSKNQLSQQQLASDAANQLRIQQQQQLLFEDFSSEQEFGRPELDTMMLGELYQHKQQQSLQAYLCNQQTNFLSEDRIIPQSPQLIIEPSNNLSASTQEASLLVAGGQDDLLVSQSEISQKNKKDATTADTIYEKQRKYYFGASETSESLTTTEAASTPDKALDVQVDEGVGLLDGVEVNDNSLKKSVKALNSSIEKNKPLDAIVELNYEASSDEQEVVQANEF